MKHKNSYKIKEFSRHSSRGGDSASCLHFKSIGGLFRFILGLSSPRVGLRIFLYFINPLPTPFHQPYTLNTAYIKIPPSPTAQPDDVNLSLS